MTICENKIAFVTSAGRGENPLRRTIKQEHSGVAERAANGMASPRLAEVTLSIMTQSHWHIVNAPEARPVNDICTKALSDEYGAALALIQANPS